MAPDPKRFRQGRNISLGPDHDRALEFLRGKTSAVSRSAVIQRLIEDKMWQRFGVNWREVLRERQQAEQDANQS